MQAPAADKTSRSECNLITRGDSLLLRIEAVKQLQLALCQKPSVYSFTSAIDVQIDIEEVVTFKQRDLDSRSRQQYIQWRVLAFYVLH